jgi:hypothetical protein
MTPRRDPRLEAIMSARIAAMPCAGCGLTLGSDPRRISRYRNYHLAGAPKERT